MYLKVRRYIANVTRESDWLKQVIDKIEEDGAFSQIEQFSS
jgi:hypothetical protein